MGKQAAQDTVKATGAGRQERFVYQDDNAIEKPFNWKQMSRLLQYIQPYRIKLIPVILATIVGTITKVSIPFLIGYTIDSAIKGKDARLLMTMSAIILVMFCIQLVMNKYRIRHMNIIGQKVIFDLRAALFKHIQNLSFRFFDQRPAGSVLVRVTNDINSLQELFTSGIVNLIIDMLQLMGIVIILLVINFKLGFAVMITVPIMFFVSTKLRKKIRRAWQDVRMNQSRINSHLNESIQGIKVTQAYTQELENIAYFDQMNMRNLRSWNRASALNQSFGPIIEVTSAIGILILFLYGSYLAQNEAMTVGTLVMFANYIGNFWEPINRLGQMYSQLLIAMASSERIFEFIDERPDVKEKSDAEELPPIKGHVVFDNVTFTYDHTRNALSGISFEIKPGQAVALVGHTGSGKTSIINALSRFYDVSGGRILVDGRDIRDVTLSSLRSQISIVLQDTFIFSGTIRDNIRFGRPDATDAEVEMAARAVHAHDFIVKLPQGYDTQVEERGNVLSMGQRQLLSFARALLADPKILILDEATASIDTETEVKIQEALRTLLSGRTSIMIAHRLSTIRHADNIIVLDHGHIIEQGNHDELMRKGGTYKALIEAQYEFLDVNVV
jgi:ATP-binding cassette subfamily B protein